jgi:hypothetical protein
MLSVAIRYEPTLSPAERRMLTLAARLPGAADELRGPFADAVKGLTTEQFRTEGAAYGSRWAALAQSTRRFKLRAGTLGRGILVNAGLMRRDLLAFTPRSWQVTNTAGRIAWLLNLAGARPYRFHHRGTRRMPARPIFPAASAPKFRGQLGQILRAWLLSLDESTITPSDVQHARETAQRLATPALKQLLDAERDR